MKHIVLFAFAVLVCGCTSTTTTKPTTIVPHNRTIEKPVFGAKSLSSAYLSIDKVEITDTLTRLYMTCRGTKFKISPKSYIVANGEKLNIISADSIDIYSESYISPKDEQKGVGFILNFQDVDSTVHTIDFIEGEEDGYFKIWDIALTDETSEQIKQLSEVPYEIISKAKNVVDDGKELDKQCNVDGYATVIGKFYGYHQGAMSVYDVKLLSSGKFMLPKMYSTSILNDGSFSITIPVSQKHQRALLEVGQFVIGDLLVACDDTVSVYIDLKGAFDNISTNSENAFVGAVYYLGANAELNNCDYSLIGDFSMMGMDKRKYKNIIRGMTLEEYKEYIMNLLDEKIKQVNKIDISVNEIEQRPLTSKVKEMYNIKLRYNAADLLFYYQHYLGSFDSEGNKYKPDVNYYSFIREFALSDKAYLYYFSWDEKIYSVASSLITGKDYPSIKPQYNVVSNEGDSLTVERKMSKTEQKIRSLIKEKFGIEDESFFESHEVKQFLRRDPLTEGFIHINDTAMAVIRNMSDPYFLKHAENINSGIYENIDRRTYWKHFENESINDSLFVELIKDYKGKVLHIDFWSATCGPCYRLISEMKEAEKNLPMDSIVFIYICDNIQTSESVYKKQSEEWGNTNFRIDITMRDLLYAKFGFAGNPAGVIVNKEGQVVKQYNYYSTNCVQIIKTILLEEAYK